jgi:hypothetical protein
MALRSRRVASSDEAWVFRSQTQLSGDLCGLFQRSAISRAVETLIELGLLERRRNPTHRWDATWQYRLNVPRLQALVRDWEANEQGHAAKPGQQHADGAPRSRRATDQNPDISHSNATHPITRAGRPEASNTENRRAKQNDEGDDPQKRRPALSVQVTAAEPRTGTQPGRSDFGRRLTRGGRSSERFELLKARAEEGRRSKEAAEDLGSDEPATIEEE